MGNTITSGAPSRNTVRQQRQPVRTTASRSDSTASAKPDATASTSRVQTPNGSAGSATSGSTTVRPNRDGSSLPPEVERSGRSSSQVNGPNGQGRSSAGGNSVFIPSPIPGLGFNLRGVDSSSTANGTSSNVRGWSAGFGLPGYDFGGVGGGQINTRDNTGRSVTQDVTGAYGIDDPSRRDRVSGSQTQTSPDGSTASGSLSFGRDGIRGTTAATDNGVSTAGGASATGDGSGNNPTVSANTAAADPTQSTAGSTTVAPNGTVSNTSASNGTDATSGSGRVDARGRTRSNTGAATPYANNTSTASSDNGPTSASSSGQTSPFQVDASGAAAAYGPNATAQSGSASRFITPDGTRGGSRNNHWATTPNGGATAASSSGGQVGPNSARTWGSGTASADGWGSGAAGWSQSGVRNPDGRGAWSQSGASAGRPSNVPNAPRYSFQPGQSGQPGQPNNRLMPPGTGGRRGRNPWGRATGNPTTVPGATGDGRYSPRPPQTPGLTPPNPQGPQGWGQPGNPFAYAGPNGAWASSGNGANSYAGPNGAWASAGNTPNQPGQPGQPDHSGQPGQPQLPPNLAFLDKIGHDFEKLAGDNKFLDRKELEGALKDVPGGDKFLKNLDRFMFADANDAGPDGWRGLSLNDMNTLANDIQSNPNLDWDGLGDMYQKRIMSERKLKDEADFWRHIAESRI